MNTPTSESDSNKLLWEAYRATRYRAETPVGMIEIRVGASCPELTQLLEARGHVRWCYITAWNPGSERPGLLENERRNVALRIDLEEAGYDVFDGCGIGDDPAWESEKSFLALGVTVEHGVELARRYGQYAILVGELGGAASLRDCRREAE